MNWVILSLGVIAFFGLLYLLLTSKFYSAEADDFLQKHYDEDYK